MRRTQFSLFCLFLLLGLMVTPRILKPEQPKPAVLADVTNSATVVTPTPTPVVTSTPTPTPTSTLTPTTTLTPTPTTVLSNLELSFVVNPPLNGSYYVADEIITITIIYRSLTPISQPLTLSLNYPLGRINDSPLDLIEALSYISGSASTSPQGATPSINLNSHLITWNIASLASASSPSQVSLKLRVLENTAITDPVLNDLILSSVFGTTKLPDQKTTLNLYGSFVAQVSPTPAIPPTPKPAEEPEQFFVYSLFGYTSSHANVRLEGLKLLEGTKANQDGYFEFVNFRASSRNLEFCLLSVDTENLVSPPLCVPVPPVEANRKYGPYLLPPTIRLDKGDIKTGQQAQVNGKTIPGASVNLNVFDQAEKPLAILIKTAYAATKPEVIKLDSASDGSFSTTLSGTNPGKKRVFAQSTFNIEENENKTPKSVTLTLNILSLFLALLIQFLGLFRSLFSLNFILFLQFLLVLYLLLRRRLIFNWLSLMHHKRTAIILYRQNSIVKAEKNYCPL
ncbi:hypothetical protein A2209_01245 [Candidatus Roizmanbacteria bacterium RIFOXYA1_FULL_41_12]|uniref:Uncharacterized protein n=1 Tax=Candidatus Roizmanbacteria bacterium RIFOXYA1_FULL_41_12 TaxID=1802082 RepID=A0A1F7KA16_9BACT|nr:MAG: hypothetical protein A2209_01245 [Candidatus Roizmanbacteria bacterium RIFOXYA1_FULL_41_12]OGK66702.1 MAG: hypothetical protein A2377_02220 [Candidatus Roizmanbacteria bacterium RIFOXYB1_FULL_41_27]OGK68561.1 MAG: hypothetical protein A2262_04260 [Candidatus Roizmanbacteria bacterium RIFOXYA2_FULL_41_8]OGK70924.1 MAG: hypothetical protein A2403_02490 [Candidatus Roizmanbacteria bacterium RIFOXYC1_FULL_41_16]OGK75497.1 MAG: hypothetical protein A2575_02215 [Candidatus Roizmanbacteria bac